MTDIFDARILCKNCGIEMKPVIINRNGFELRAVKCLKCGDKIIHPADLNVQEHFNGLKGKTFSVKLRMVGNSHAVSIPKEIVNFINERHKEMKKQMDDMVRLCFEDFDRLSLRFGNGDEDFNDKSEEDEDENSLNRMKIKKIRRQT